MLSAPNSRTWGAPPIPVCLASPQRFGAGGPGPRLTSWVFGHCCVDVMGCVCSWGHLAESPTATRGREIRVLSWFQCCLRAPDFRQVARPLPSLRMVSTVRCQQCAQLPSLCHRVFFMEKIIKTEMPFNFINKPLPQRCIKKSPPHTNTVSPVST